MRGVWWSLDLGQRVPRRHMALSRSGVVGALWVAACGCSEATSSIDRVSPAQVAADVATPVQLQGRGLANGVRLCLDCERRAELQRTWEVQVGERALDPDQIELLDSRTLSVVIPAGLSVGWHDLRVESPGGSVYELPSSLEVRASAMEDAGAARDASSPAVDPDGPSATPPDAGCVGLACRLCAVFPPPQLLTGFGRSGALSAPSIADNNTILFFVEVDAGENIWWAQRPDRGTIFGAATSSVLSAGVTGSPFLSQDGLHLHFSTDRAGGLGGRDIWWDQRATITSYFTSPEPLASVNGASDDDLPTLSEDERSIIFTSNRSGGQGAGDLWVAQRASASAAFEPPVNLAELNTGAEENSPALSRDGLTLYFASNRTGSSDIWFATRASRTSAFGTAINLITVNSFGSEVNPAISPDGLELFLSSDRSGSVQLWRSLRTCL